MLKELQESGCNLSLDTHWRLARKAFASTAAYDRAIANKLDVARLAEFSAPHPSYADLIRSLGDQAFAGSTQARTLERRLRFNRLLP